MRIELKDNTELTVTDACTSTSIVAEFIRKIYPDGSRERLNPEFSH